MNKLHPKIEALRKSVGSTPILRAHVATKVTQPVQMRAAKNSNDNGRLLRQYFAVWGVPDDYGTVPIKGCFSKSIQERGPASNAAYKITALYMHSQPDSVGLPVELIEDEVGLYAEVPVLEGIQVCDELVIRHASGTCNNGSYGFNYIWDKMEYDDKLDAIIMKECDLQEISFVTIGAQKETFGVRKVNGNFEDDTLIDETENFIKRISRKDRLELRSLIDRHITLAKLQPHETIHNALDKPEPLTEDLYDYLLNNLKI